MCFSSELKPTPQGASIALFLVLMEYPLPGPVIALLSQEKAALAPKSYLISSGRKSIKITLVYAKDQPVATQEHLQSNHHHHQLHQTYQQVMSAAAATTTETGTSHGTAMSGFTTTTATISKTASATSLSSSSSSLSSSAERKKPRHATQSSGRQSRRKKKKRSKSSRHTSRSSVNLKELAMPRVTKLSESSSSAASSGAEDHKAPSVTTNNADFAQASRRHRKSSAKRREESCSTPEFPLFGRPDDDVVRSLHRAEQMSTVDSGIPSSNCTVAHEQTAESGNSDVEDNIGVTVKTLIEENAKALRAKTSQDKKSAETLKQVNNAESNAKSTCQDTNDLNAKTNKETNKEVKNLATELPRRTRNISESISSTSSSSSSSEDESRRKKKPLAEKNDKSNGACLAAVAAANTNTPTAPTVTPALAAAPVPHRLAYGGDTPIRREEMWRTWTRIPRTQAPPPSSRLLATPATASSRRSLSPNTSTNHVDGGMHQNSAVGYDRDSARPPRPRLLEGVSWDGSGNL